MGRWTEGGEVDVGLELFGKRLANLVELFVLALLS